jgi:osmotically-inducible protein OsmY
MKTDAALQTDVINELKWEPTVHHEHIGVSVQDGVVTISGTVPTFIEKKNAEKAVERVTGVISIVEKIEVKLLGTMIRDDESIAKAILNRFQWSVVVPNQKIKATVSDGRVTLHGEADWEYERKAAENLVRELTGVKFISNNITIKPALSITDLKKDIENALVRAVKRESNEIKIDVTGNKVTLSGRVQSLKEKKIIEGAVWRCSGVSSVNDKLQVSSN